MMEASQAHKLYNSLPDHPKNIYPSWEINDQVQTNMEESDNQTQLLDQYGGQGVLSWYGATGEVLPEEARHFIKDQYLRFGVNPPVDKLIEWCWQHTYYYADQMDPYVLLGGCCDVIKTEENYFYQYSFANDRRTHWTEALPGDVETFRYWEDGNKAWDILMGHPGLEHYFDFLHDYFCDHFAYITEDDHPECYSVEWEFIRRYGSKQAENIAHLGVWASIMWMCSPMARKWRYEHHPIFEMCYDNGECVIRDWTFYSKEYYRRDERPALTCACCGISEWCVELIQVNSEDAKFLCEHCLQPSPESYASCGKRMCTKASCAHHPGTEAARMIAADSRYGEIKQLENGQKVRDMPGMMYINQKMIDHYSTGIASAVGDDLRNLLPF